MARRNKKVRRQYTLVHTVCCVVFCVLIFLYLYFYQGDVMALAQHILSGGATTYDKFIGASVITFVMFLVHSFVYSILRLDRWFYWLTYLPSFLLIAILGDVTPDGSGSVYNNVWFWLAPLILVVYVVIVRMLGEVDALGRDDVSTGSLFSKVMWTNLLSITVMMLVTIGAGNTDVMLHNRIKVENAIIAGRYEEALSIGNEYQKTDESLTMLRAYVLSLKGELGERLFEYPLTGGSSALRPNGKNVNSLMIYEGDILMYINSKTPGSINHSADYNLCALLMDRRTDVFERELKRHYSIDSTLPKHYKEALLLARNVTPGDSVEYADASVMAAYTDFLSIRKKYTSHLQMQQALKERFGNTYWYYYYCGHR